MTWPCGHERTPANSKPKRSGVICRACANAAQRRYSKTPKGRASARRYRKTPKGRASERRQWATNVNRRNFDGTLAGIDRRLRANHKRREALIT